MLTVRNKNGCLDLPFFQCSKVCLVRIEVPTGAPPKSLQVFQESGDTTPGLTVDVEGVRLQDFLLRGIGGLWYHFAGSTLELAMRNTVVDGTLGVSLQGGAAIIEKSVLKGAVRLVSQENSVYIMDSPVPQQGEPLQLSWRQVDARAVFAATTLGYASADAHP